MDNEMMQQEMTEQEGTAVAAIDYKAAKKTFSKVGFWFLVGALLFNGLQIGVVSLCNAVAPDVMRNGDLALLIQMAPVYVLAMPFLIWILSKLPGEELPKRKLSVGQFLTAMAIAYAIVYLSNIVGMVLTQIIGAVKGSAVDNVMVDLITEISPWTRILVMVVCAPIFEELIFRKMLVTRTVKYGEGVAIVVSGLLFGLFHGNLNQFAYAFTLGAFFAFVFVKTGNILYTIGLHIFINFMSGVFGGLLLDMIEYDKMMEVFNAGGTEMVEFVASHAIGFVLFACYFLLLVVLVISGVVLFLVNRKKFKLEKKEFSLEKGKRFSTVVLNIGMGLYCLFWVVMIVIQLLA